MKKSKKIQVEGKEITVILDKQHEYISLTDMLKAKECQIAIQLTQ